MGNMLLRGFVHRHGRRITIMKADGTVMKLRSAVSVKEIIIDYPDHAIFEAAPAGPDSLGTGMSFSRPLPEREVLVAGHLYYLIPLPYYQIINYNYNNNVKRGHFARVSSHHSIPSARSWLQPQSSADIATDSIKQKADCAVNKVNRGGVRIVSSSYSTDGSTVQVKLRLRKEDLASFLSALIQNDIRGQSPWKPRLDVIAEPHSPVEDL